MHDLMRDTPKRERRDKAPTSAFTLVELLIVIAIIGIMAVTVAISLSAIT